MEELEYYVYCEVIVRWKEERWVPSQRGSGGVVLEDWKGLKGLYSRAYTKFVPGICLVPLFLFILGFPMSIL
jgi:hypothetical protein